MNKTYQLAAALLFADNTEKLSRKTGITVSTLKRRKANPGKVTLDECADLANAQQLSDEAITMMIREIMKRRKA